MQVTSSRGVIPEPTEREIFTGEVHTHMLLDVPLAQQLRFNLVSFLPGGRTRWHTHAFEQALIVTTGRGIVANEAAEHVVQPGDIVVVAPEEKHWHGATATTGMTHVAINQAGETTVLEAVEHVQSE